MSPLNTSMQNLTATSPNALGGSPLRRVPPSLPGLPTRPVAPRESRSDSRSSLPAPNKANESQVEKISQPIRAQNGDEAKKDKAASLTGKVNGDTALTGASGVARLIAEANRRAQDVGKDTVSSSRTSASPAKAKGESTKPEELSLTRSVPTLPTRSNFPPHETTKSVPELPEAPKPSQALQPPPRHTSSAQAPPRKGSLNASMRNTPVVTSAASSDRSRSASIASTDSGKLRRLPPLLPTHAFAKEPAGKQEDIVESPMDAMQAGPEAPNPEGKRAKPIVPPKPKNL